MDISLVFPAYPPRIDGIGDHTANLAGALAGATSVTVLTGQPPHAGPDAVGVRAVFDADQKQSAIRLRAALLELSPDWVLLQYNPFSYGTWGYNPYLPRAISKVASESRSKIALMIHEPCMPPDNLQFRIMRLWQKRQLNSLMRSADLAFFSITAWTDEFSKEYPDVRVRHLPIGSNIPVVSGDRNSVRDRYKIGSDDVLLGVFGSGHPNRLFPFIHEAVKNLRESGRSCPLLYVGGSSDKLGAVFQDTAFIDAGKLSAEDVSLHLQAMDVYLCPFGKGVSSRRGSFMAGIEHGLPCITTSGSQSDQFLLDHEGESFLAGPDSDPSQFSKLVEQVVADSDLRVRLGMSAKNLYRERFQWDSIAASALAEMNEVN